jgi:ribonuclease VapC
LIVDSSAIIAVINREPQAESILRAMEEAYSLAIGAPTVSELSIVAGCRWGFDSNAVRVLLEQFEVETIPFGALHAQEAIRAYQKFGKGRHPAALNYGDCLSYAVASLAGQPLLCIGKDFELTDLKIVSLQTAG